MSQDRKPRVAVIGCGGTISTVASHDLDFIEYPETGRKLQADEVVKRLGQAASFADIEAIPFRSVGSSALGPREWLEIVAHHRGP